MLRRSRDDKDMWRPIGEIDPTDGSIRLYGDPDMKPWYVIGQHLYEGRKNYQISKREAARRAGISEGLWRQLEAGGKQSRDKIFLPNPRPENLYAAAVAVGQDPQLFFAELGLDTPYGLFREIFDHRLADKITYLTERDQKIVEQLVDSMLKVDSLLKEERDPTDDRT